ncbi:uncharacterized protein EDB93DRAFT_1108611 [Suillus bovinus]|uniref:uncharacterized protein n=1 Tax=Suillus bovinus TaxID=48563 RepID=UPI001B879CFD|nr:uncharacterized protein EDB93DRAFT_1108611 [Suillus bovinus]KAG2129684.1 hypothetical protein EDB93DRAFT_1108611 [Suillus bovinus]
MSEYQDMFMRYTHLGIGRAAILRRISKDCLGSVLPARTDTMDIVNPGDQDGMGEVGNSNGEALDLEGNDDEREDCKDCKEFNNDSSNDELSEGGGDENRDEDGHNDDEGFKSPVLLQNPSLNDSGIIANLSTPMTPAGFSCCFKLKVLAVSQAGPPGLWKVLVLGQQMKDVMFKFQPVYFIALYESFHLNFVEPLPRVLLEELPGGLCHEHGTIQGLWNHVQLAHGIEWASHNAFPQFQKYGRSHEESRRWWWSSLARASGGRIEVQYRINSSHREGSVEFVAKSAYDAQSDYSAQALSHYHYVDVTSGCLAGHTSFGKHSPL